MLREIMLWAGVLCAVAGLGLSLWGLWDDRRKRRDRHENEE